MTRTGIAPGHGLVYMPIDDVVTANDAELYGAEPGLLGDELATAGVSRAVIANGDGSDPSTPEERVSPYRRAAVAALMTHDGRVPGVVRSIAPCYATIQRRPSACASMPTRLWPRSERRGSRVRSCWSKGPIWCAPTLRDGSRQTNSGFACVTGRCATPTGSWAACSQLSVRATR